MPIWEENEFTGVVLVLPFWSPGAVAISSLFGDGALVHLPPGAADSAVHLRMDGTDLIRATNSSHSLFVLKPERFITEMDSQIARTTRVV